MGLARWLPLALVLAAPFASAQHDSGFDSYFVNATMREQLARR